MSKTSSRFLFWGGALWLDFVNTERMRDGERVDLIESADDLYAWLSESGALTEAESVAASRQVSADWAMREAKGLRGALRLIAQNLAEGASPLQEDAVGAVNAHLSRRRGCMRLTAKPGGWLLELHAEDARGHDFLFSVAQSAADFLTRGDPGLIRQCESARCILYFHDGTKNHGRRWCSMEGCGNRHKAAKRYRRLQEKSSPSKLME